MISSVTAGAAARSKRARLAHGLAVTGLGRLLRLLPTWRGVLVISYHRIGDRERSNGHRSLYSGTAELLDAQLGLLRDSCEVLAPEEVDGATFRRPGRRVLITFDDGYRDLYEVAHPVLLGRDVRALMFICSGFVDGTAVAWWDDIARMLRTTSVTALPPGPWSTSPLPLGDGRVERAIDVLTRHYWLLRPAETEQLMTELADATGRARSSPQDARSRWITWEMARELQTAGHRIGAHTVNHPLLARLEPEDQFDEIDNSVSRIEEELGRRPNALAYPVGDRTAFDAATISAARDAGIELAFSNYGGVARGKRFEPLDIPRVAAETLGSSELFAAALGAPQLFAPAG